MKSQLKMMLLRVKIPEVEAVEVEKEDGKMMVKNPTEEEEEIEVTEEEENIEEEVEAEEETPTLTMKASRQSLTNLKQEAEVIEAEVIEEIEEEVNIEAVEVEDQKLLQAPSLPVAPKRPAPEEEDHRAPKFRLILMKRNLIERDLQKALIRAYDYK